MPVAFSVVAGPPGWIGQHRMGLHGLLQPLAMLPRFLQRCRWLEGVGVMAAQHGPVGAGNVRGGGLGFQAQHRVEIRNTVHNRTPYFLCRLFRLRPSRATPWVALGEVRWSRAPRPGTNGAENVSVGPPLLAPSGAVAGRDGSRPFPNRLAAAGQFRRCGSCQRPTPAVRSSRCSARDDRSLWT